MKRFLISSIFAAIVATGTAMMPQDYPDEYLGLPGDNLNLYAVMKLFQESETLEGFERSLNDENTRINNLDLNNDNYIDYVKVLDYADGNVHTVVLQAVLDRNESQDVAVFTVERLRDGSVQIQLVGDEDLYGRNYIIEPYYAETPNPGYTGRPNKQNVTVVRTTYVEVSAWPVIRFMYMPGYIGWRSSWYWGYYPAYWNPWRPYYWHYYYGYHYNWYSTYYGHFHRYDRHRWDGWDRYYYRDRRVYSKNVTININSGRYKNTYSRPEMRKDGEALYAKAHPERAATMSTGSGRRNPSQASSTRSSDRSVSSSSRRSTGTANNSSNGNRSQNPGVSTSRRSEGSTGNSSSRSTNPEAGTSRRSEGASGSQNSGTVNRSTTTTTTRSSRTNGETGNTTETTRRSTESVVRTSPESSNPSGVQRSGSSGSSSRQESASRRSSSSAPKASAPRQSSSKSSSTGSSKSSSKSSGKSKSSDNKSSRRN